MAERSHTQHLRSRHTPEAYPVQLFLQFSHLLTQLGIFPHQVRAVLIDFVSQVTIFVGTHLRFFQLLAQETNLILMQVDRDVKVICIFMKCALLVKCSTLMKRAIFVLFYASEVSCVQILFHPQEVFYA